MTIGHAHHYPTLYVERVCSWCGNTNQLHDPYCPCVPANRKDGTKVATFAHVPPPRPHQWPVVCDTCHASWYVDHLRDINEACPWCWWRERYAALEVLTWKVDERDEIEAWLARLAALCHDGLLERGEVERAIRDWEVRHRAA